MRNLNGTVAPLVARNHSDNLTMLYSPHSNVPSILQAPMAVVDLRGLKPFRLI